jgi:hypothetical protein
LKDYVKEVEEELKTSWKKLAARASEVMDQKEVEKFTTNEGVTVSKDFQVRGKVVNSIKFFNYLDEKEDSSLGKLELAPHILPDNIKEIINNSNPDDVKINVHWRTMSSYVKEVCDPLNPKTWPGGVDVEAWPDVKVKY